MCFKCNQLTLKDFIVQTFFEKHHHRHHTRIFAYLMDLFVESHQQQVSELRWAVKRAMIFGNVEICAVDDAANAVLCNYNPYFMVVGVVLWKNADSAVRCNTPGQFLQLKTKIKRVCLLSWWIMEVKCEWQL